MNIYMIGIGVILLTALAGCGPTVKLSNCKSATVVIQTDSNRSFDVGAAVAASVAASQQGEAVNSGDSKSDAMGVK